MDFINKILMCKYIYIYKICPISFNDIYLKSVVQDTSNNMGSVSDPKLQQRKI